MAKKMVATEWIGHTKCDCSWNCKDSLDVAISKDGRHLLLTVWIRRRRYDLRFNGRSLRGLYKALQKAVDHLDPESQEMVRGLINRNTSS